MIKVKQPQLFIIEEIVKKNIINMKQKADNNNIRFRPHFKTHQSLEIGKWFSKRNINQITASSMRMAKYFADGGGQDILIAFPVNINEIDGINELAGKIKLSLLVDSISTVQVLSEKLIYGLNVWLKIDTGYGRAGIPFDNEEKIKQTVAAILSSKNMGFQGILSHYGQTYSEKSKEGIKSVYETGTRKMISVKKLIEKELSVEVQISIGDTPSCSVLDSFEGVDEIRPGNFVFYDLMQLETGSCTESDLGCFVACPVVSIYKERNQVLIYGGAVHLSKEYLIDENGGRLFGYAADMNNDGFLSINKNIKLSSLSQEHGIVAFDNGIPGDLIPGDSLYIVPVHSCLTANLYSHYITNHSKVISKMQS